MWWCQSVKPVPTLALWCGSFLQQLWEAYSRAALIVLLIFYKQRWRVRKRGLVQIKHSLSKLTRSTPVAACDRLKPEQTSYLNWIKWEQKGSVFKSVSVIIIVSFMKCRIENIAFQKLNRTFVCTNKKRKKRTKKNRTNVSLINISNEQKMKLSGLWLFVYIWNSEWNCLKSLCAIMVIQPWHSRCLTRHTYWFF